VVRQGRAGAAAARRLTQTPEPDSTLEVSRVTTLELFFDLVFVFTIAELTSVLFADPSARGVVQVFLMLGVIWWMYGGYAWLTNAVSAHTTLRRLLLLGGMGGYFVLSHLDVDLALVAIALVGLALSACLWWIYFGGGEDEVEEALATLPQRERSFAALNAFGYWHFPLLFGIVAIASVEREAISHPFSELSWARAALLAAGVGAYLAGDVFFRRTLRLRTASVRGAAALLTAATVPVGATLSAFAQIALLVALLAIALASERPARRARPGATVSV
jgi:low temperature requirement protein LtrA